MFKIIIKLELIDEWISPAQKLYTIEIESILKIQNKTITPANQTTKFDWIVIKVVELHLFENFPIGNRKAQFNLFSLEILEQTIRL